MKKRLKTKVFLELSCAFLFLGVSLFSSTSLFAQQKEAKVISVDFKDVSVLRALHEINRLSGDLLSFQEEVVMKETKKITLKRENVAVIEVVKACLEGTGLQCSEQANGRILIGAKQVSKLIEVSGRVTDEKGNPIAGATVLIQGTTRGVASDAEGRYVINVLPTDVLRFSFIGYEPRVVEVKGKKKLNVSLNPTAENIEEVTVVAFGEQKKESVVSAITSVDTRTLKSSSSDLTTQFAGKIPGMIAWQTGGLPAALTEEEMNTKFYIRGITSFQSNANIDPLILIDGVESSKLDLSRIPVEDIESFNVMKDASATAMYGARGANGVILITTKKGEEGSVYTSLRYEVVASSATKKIDVVDPVTYMKMYNEALLARNPDAMPQYSLERIERTGSKNYPSWVYPANDWYKILFNDYSVNHRAGLNIRGGSRVIQYYTSINYNYDEGMLKTDRLNQFDCNIKNNAFTFRTNLNIDLNAGIKLLINSSASLDKYHGPISDVSQAYWMVFQASPVDFAPTYPGDKASSWPHIRFGSLTQQTINPYLEIQKGYNERSRYSATIRAEYIHNLSTLLKGLELRGIVAMQKTGYYENPLETEPFRYSLTDYDFETGEHKLQALNPDNARRTLQIPQYSGPGVSVQTTQMNYELRGLHTAAWDEHQTSLTAVLSLQENTSSGAQNVLTSLPHRNVSFSMRGTYGFKDRYFVEASFGYNGSERFDKNHQWGFFPAVGGAWIASKEPFMQGISKWISFLKFRLSWGQVGNDGVISSPRYAYLPDIDYRTPKSPIPDVDLAKRYLVKSYANSKISWEIADQVNLGIELKLLGGIFEVNADIYQEIRKNILDYRTTVPATMGFEQFQLANMGRVRSRGVDLSGKIQHAFSPDFWLILNGTFTYNKAIYQEIDEAPNKPTWQLRKGHEISQAIGYIAEGLFRDQAEIDHSPRQGGNVMPGDIRYRDLNNDGVIDVNDATYIGFPETPRTIYGLSAFVSYKNMEFNIAFQGSGKRGFFMNPMQINPFVDDRAMLKEIYEDHWSESNMARRPFWPRLSTSAINEHNPQEDWYSGAEVRKSTYFMRECKFLRCTAIELAYNLPAHWREKMGTFKLFARVNNPFIITDFKTWDPELGESGFNYPIQRTFSFGVNVSF
ncbi:SusC/RagA family TonB-linked outer membrane protein [Butyricimonas synergistica]|uniref:SusC/RagA family TonB-linked outer membrane protein n=1 Tax=Butyricimonas synergistica TaxID=544644 RepID=UPI0022E4A843|nr:TonB-dependent receptor [Butyricimonas synergistica]